ncbi:hypothetical protein Taro_007916 [Colocasia esculenta]|uniref:Uncharacterized protein n=1 Tax=Colocasia esculenta TaxID=4460 RepID=A0A843U5F6_COLES|nr:hypothetical protein [Colocasia esculenta]
MAAPVQATSVTGAINRIERAHQMYREGRHEEALAFYTESLAMARTKAQRIALHSNRAACYLKLHDFTKAAEECTSVLELDHQHTGALMLRAQTLVTLKEYQSALFDVNRLMELNPSSDVYRNLQARLKTQLSLAPIPESEEETVVPEEEEEESIEDAGKNVEQPVSIQESTATQAQSIKDSASGHPGGWKAIPKPKGQSGMDHSYWDIQDVGKKVEQTVSIQESAAIQTRNTKSSANGHPRGWEAIPKPKGHSGLDYSRWDKVEDDSSEDEEEEEEEEQPRYRFRVRTVGGYQFHGFSADLITLIWQCLYPEGALSAKYFHFTLNVGCVDAILQFYLFPFLQ